MSLFGSSSEGNPNLQVLEIELAIIIAYLSVLTLKDFYNFITNTNTTTNTNTNTINITGNKDNKGW